MKPCSPSLRSAAPLLAVAGAFLALGASQPTFIAVGMAYLGLALGRMWKR